MLLKNFFLIGLLSVTFTLFSQASPERDLLLAYFPEYEVTETLSRFKVPEEKWIPINQALAIKDDQIIQLVAEKASKMDPNPMEDLSLRKEAVKLFREVLYQVFSEVLVANGVTEADQIKEMLDSVQQLKADRFNLCMKGQKISTVPPESGLAAN